MQCASSTTSSPTRSANSGSIQARNCGLLSRSGLISSRSTASLCEQLLDLGPRLAVGRVDRVGSDAEPLRGRDLVAHQRQQRRDDQRRAGALLAQQRRRDEVHRGLAPARALDAQHARAVLDQVGHGLALVLAEAGSGSRQALEQFVHHIDGRTGGGYFAPMGLLSWLNRNATASISPIPAIGAPTAPRSVVTPRARPSSGSSTARRRHDQALHRGQRRRAGERDRDRARTGRRATCACTSAPRCAIRVDGDKVVLDVPEIAQKLRRKPPAAGVIDKAVNWGDQRKLKKWTPRRATIIALLGATPRSARASTST